MPSFHSSIIKPWYTDCKKSIKDFWPGVIVTFTVVLAVKYIAETQGGSTMLLALLLGMALNFLSADERLIAGIQFCAKTLLRVGITLLGLRIALSDIYSLGIETLLLVIACVVTTLLFTLVLAKLLKIESYLAIIIGGATGICGASAALALSSALPKNKKIDNELSFAIISVTTLSTVAMVIYPGVSHFMGFNELQAGILFGATIHDVAQVVGAGYAVSDNVGDTSILVKLSRVALLLPVVVVVGIIFSQEKSGNLISYQVPLFLVGFVILCALNSLEWVQDPIRSTGIEVSRWLLVSAVAAIGLTTSLRRIFELGFGYILLSVGATLYIFVLALTWLAFLT